MHFDVAIKTVQCCTKQRTETTWLRHARLHSRVCIEIYQIVAAIVAAFCYLVQSILNVSQYFPVSKQNE
jgi:hypothetical protein